MQNINLQTRPLFGIGQAIWHSLGFPDTRCPQHLDFYSKSQLVGRSVIEGQSRCLHKVRSTLAGQAEHHCPPFHIFEFTFLNSSLTIWNLEFTIQHSHFRTHNSQFGGLIPHYLYLHETHMSQGCFVVRSHILSQKIYSIQNLFLEQRFHCVCTCYTDTIHITSFSQWLKHLCN